MTSACTLVVGYSAVVGACQRVDRELHACGQLQYGLANQGLIFSLVLFYYFTLGSYVYNYAQWQGRTPLAYGASPASHRTSTVGDRGPLVRARYKRAWG